jgi:hypothetical protein
MTPTPTGPGRSRPRKNLILSGGIGHDFAATSAVLRESLAGLGVESVIVDTMEAACVLLESADADLLTVNCLRWQMLADRFAARRASEAWTTPPRFRAAVTAHLASGHGLLALHTAVICFDDWPEWRTIVGGAWNWRRSWHPEHGPVAARVRGAHPIVRGLQTFVVDDELYCDLDLEADVDALIDSTMDGRTHPLLWARRYRGGRVVCNLLGHHVDSSAALEHATINRRSALWAMGADDCRVADVGACATAGASATAAQ